MIPDNILILKAKAELLKRKIDKLSAKRASLKGKNSHSKFGAGE